MTPSPRARANEPEEAVVVRQAPLADRVRAHLANRPTMREVAMFGGLAFMVDDRMVVSVQRNGDSLLVRVDPDDDGRLLDVQGAQRAQMGRGRSMGEGWISVASDALATDEGLDRWMDVALEFHRSKAGGTP